MTNQYINNLINNEKISKEYYIKSIEKTQQQLFLEKLLSNDDLNNKQIADVACGAGTLSFHLNNIYKNAQFFLVEKNEKALDLAKDLNEGNNFEFINDDIYTLEKLSKSQFDFTFCWQTLSWLDDPERALNQLIRITKRGGKIYLSSLFNLERDVDIYSKVIDHTREHESSYAYNTYSKYSVLKWLENKVKQVEFIPFVMEMDINYDGKGLGTNTVHTNSGRLQISGGMLLNWAILVLEV